MRVYIAGRVTGMPDDNEPAFRRAQTKLEAEGRFTVVVPHDLHAGEPNMSHAACMRRCLVELLACDAVLLLPGWEDSEGATLERAVAVGIDLQIWRG